MKYFFYLSNGKSQTVMQRPATNTSKDSAIHLQRNGVTTLSKRWQQETLESHNWRSRNNPKAELLLLPTMHGNDETQAITLQKEEPLSLVKLKENGKDWHSQGFEF